MPKKKEPELTPEEQFKRFQEAAKEHEIEKRLPEIEKAFDSSTERHKRFVDMEHESVRKSRCAY